MSKERRRELFATYNIYLSEEDFFNAHFAKYPVISLSFKSDTPESYADAVSYLKDAILKAVEPYVLLLRRRSRALKADGENDTLESEVWTSILARVERALLTLEEGERYTKPDITRLIPLVMQALSSCPGMGKSVVLIDEYDKPLVHALCDDSIDLSARKRTHDLFTSFYTAIFKSNEFLEFGIMMGVFNVPLRTWSSGLNNIETFLAHTGAPRPSLDVNNDIRPKPRFHASTSGNPFEEAINLTVNDVWGLVNDHIDRLAPTTLPEASTSSIAERKQAMLAHCLKSYDGYTYGNLQTVFNTYCVLRFFKGLGKRVEVPVDNPSAHYYWSQTGSITMIRSLRADNAQEFLTYVDRLSREYVQRHSYLYGGKSAAGILAEKLKELDIGSQPEYVAQYMYALLPFGTDPYLFRLANICYDEGRSSLTDWGSSGLSVGAIFRQFYQAGYLTPRDNGTIGIPNEDVFNAFQREARCIFSASGMTGGILDPTLHAIGIGAGNFVQFASYVNSTLATSLRVSEASMREDYYHGWLQALLTPLRYYGFDQRTQGSAEGGFSDLELIPPGRNELLGAVQAKKAERPYVIFKFKRLACGRSFEAAMAVANRKKVLGQAKKSCRTAIAQINDRYKHSMFTHADGSSALYLVGLTFWRQRFLMHVSRLVPQVGSTGPSTWSKQPYEATETMEPTTSSVRISIEAGNFIANTILTE
ncbi:hypothetical protein IWW37_003335 [Coemansia sp. RSA 2050]|nr:hypothetical protein IWW37_003335 [Coemansia sp. RSA 2050]